MSYGNKKQCTASNGVRAKVIEPKRLLKRTADISAKTAIIIAAMVWLSGGVFQSAADTSDVKDAVGVIQGAEVENLSEDSATDDKSLTNTDIQNDDTDTDDEFLNPTLGVLTSNFGTRWGRLHSGIDIGADEGEAICAAKSGRVIFSGTADGYGNYIKIDHGGGLETAYGHCSVLAANVGDEVEKGQTIAYVGSTGYSTGPHLHFEVKIDGEFKNPLDYVVY